MDIFSFCIYGNDNKYYYGLKENVKLINMYYPEHSIYIYCGKTINNEYINNIKNTYKNVYLFETNQDGAANMLYRYKPIVMTEASTVIIRDADSEINERDRHCINDFIACENNLYYCQTIRDHYWHKSKITGGLTHFKNINNSFEIIKNVLLNIFNKIETMTSDETNIAYIYGVDESTLNEQIYPLIKNNILVYTNICAYEGEHYKNIDFINDGTNFCGNVVEYKDENKKAYKFNYFDFDIMGQIIWLINQKQYDLVLKLISEYSIERAPYHKQAAILDYQYVAHYNNKNLQECMNVYKHFYKYKITDHVKNNAQFCYDLARQLGYKIIGTGDTDYLPGINEIVIYFGNYPDDYMALPQSRQIYKNAMYREQIKLDEYKSDMCWDNVDQIFIMGLENEHERINSTIIQLAIMNAPLDKIFVYKAKKDIELTDVYIGATKNHLDCMKIMKDRLYKCCLFLEDDFIFTSTINDNKTRLSEFFQRKYDYDICFLSASKYHERADWDDLLILSKQPCTTSSGYLLNSSTIDRVYNVVNEGYELLKTTGISEKYCIDRYWQKLQSDNKVFIFKNKLGFQKPSMSKIAGKLNCELD